MNGMKATGYILLGGILFTGVFVGGCLLGALGMYAITRDDIQRGMAAKKHEEVLA